MERTLVSQLAERIGQHVTLQGWVHALRDQKHTQFLVLRDHTGLAQAVLEKTDAPALAETLSGLPRESAVCLSGRVAANPRVRLGGLEIRLSGLTVENPAAAPLPVDPAARDLPALDLRLDWRHLDLRRPENRLIFEVQTTAERAMREFWHAENFLEIHTPKLMASPSESGAELFCLDYFGAPAYLAQSPQFYKQMAMAAGFDRIFEIGPVFRANPSFTSRHDTEFTSVDIEIAWIASHADLMAFEERWLRHVLETVRQCHGREIERVFGVPVHVPALPFPRLALAEAIELLVERGWAPPSHNDLDPPGERHLGEYVQEVFGHEFVFLTDYPAVARPFYHMRLPGRPDLTRSFDLLWKGLEVTTGAQREHRPDILARQAIEKGLSLEPIRFYLDFFAYGCPPHGGFGFGLTRMLMVLLGVSNVREVTYLYRGPRRLSP